MHFLPLIQYQSRSLKLQAQPFEELNPSLLFLMMTTHSWGETKTKSQSRSFSILSFKNTMPMIVPSRHHHVERQKVFTYITLRCKINLCTTIRLTTEAQWLHLSPKYLSQSSQLRNWITLCTTTYATLLINWIFLMMTTNSLLPRHAVFHFVSHWYPE